MLSLLDAQGAVGFGDQPVAAVQAVAALGKPVERQGAAILWRKRGHHHAGVEVDLPRVNPLGLRPTSLSPDTNIGYCMAAGMGTGEQVLRHDLSVKFPDEGTEARLAALAAALESIADEAEVSAVLAVSEHVLLPDPPVS
jgi:hypothetical protein